MIARLSPLALIALGCALIAALILVVYLVIRPRLTGAVKGWLLLGLGVLPIGTALSGNIQGFEATKDRSFCGSCHLMTLHTQDSDDVRSGTLSSRHGRNRLFGEQNCYACHADYGMFGTLFTKLGGMKHVYYNLTEYRSTTLEEASKSVRLRSPYPNDNCRQCHSTTLELWQKVPDHRATLVDTSAGRVSCASSGCHGLAHPYFTAEPAPAASGAAR